MPVISDYVITVTPRKGRAECSIVPRPFFRGGARGGLGTRLERTRTVPNSREYVQQQNVVCFISLKEIWAMMVLLVLDECLTLVASSANLPVVFAKTHYNNTYKHIII